MKCTDKFKGKFHILHKPLKTFRGSLEGSIHSLHFNSSPCAFKALKVQLPAHLGEQGARGKGPLKPSSMGHTSLTTQPKTSWPNILSWGWKGENCAGLQHIFLFLNLVCTGFCISGWAISTLMNSNANMPIWTSRIFFHVFLYSNRYSLLYHLSTKHAKRKSTKKHRKLETTNHEIYKSVNNFKNVFKQLSGLYLYQKCPI